MTQTCGASEYQLLCVRRLNTAVHSHCFWCSRDGGGRYASSSFSVPVFFSCAMASTVSRFSCAETLYGCFSAKPSRAFVARSSPPCVQSQCAVNAAWLGNEASHSRQAAGKIGSAPWGGNLRNRGRIAACRIRTRPPWSYGRVSCVLRRYCLTGSAELAAQVGCSVCCSRCKNPYRVGSFAWSAGKRYSSMAASTFIRDHSPLRR